MCFFFFVCFVLVYLLERGFVVENSPIFDIFLVYYKRLFYI
jgi:hypothetical protein